MTEKQVSDVALMLRTRGFLLKEGLTEKQISDVEQFYKIQFPPDLKMLFQSFVPASDKFYDWSDFSASNVKRIQEMLKRPIEGILFDVKENHFWMNEWGERPIDNKFAVNVATDKLSNVPQLIPVYSHRYLPSKPLETDNPIISVVQTDIIYYGKDLYDYISVEFCGKDHCFIDFDSIKTGLPFWKYFLE